MAVALEKRLPSTNKTMNAPTFTNVPNELVTTTDGRQVYLSRSVAVTLVLVHMDTNGFFKIAIEKRGNKPGLDKQGFWCLPCGYLDFNETGTQAVKREVWEEIGIDLETLSLFSITNSRVSLVQPYWVKTDPKENRQNVVLHYGLVFVKMEPPTLIPNNYCEPNEVADAVWASYSDILLDKYEFAFDHKKIIQDFWTMYIKEN
jgi:ADP-ribose pyrophosphatase YjhB (NUDIX family)